MSEELDKVIKMSKKSSLSMKDMLGVAKAIKDIKKMEIEEDKKGDKQYILDKIKESLSGKKMFKNIKDLKYLEEDGVEYVVLDCIDGTSKKLKANFTSMSDIMTSIFGM